MQSIEYYLPCSKIIYTPRTWFNMWVGVGVFLMEFFHSIPAAFCFNFLTFFLNFEKNTNFLFLDDIGSKIPSFHLKNTEKEISILPSLLL